MNNHDWSPDIDKEKPDQVSSCIKCGVIRKLVGSTVKYFPKQGKPVKTRPECK